MQYLEYVVRLDVETLRGDVERAFRDNGYDLAWDTAWSGEVANAGLAPLPFLRSGIGVLVFGVGEERAVVRLQRLQHPFGDLVSAGFLNARIGRLGQALTGDAVIGPAVESAVKR